MMLYKYSIDDVGVDVDDDAGDGDDDDDDGDEPVWLYKVANSTTNNPQCCQTWVVYGGINQQTWTCLNVFGIEFATKKVCHQRVSREMAIIRI